MLILVLIALVESTSERHCEERPAPMQIGEAICMCLTDKRLLHFVRNDAPMKVPEASSQQPHFEIDMIKVNV